MNYVFRDPMQLTMDALFQSSGVDGVRGRTELFEKVVEGLTALITKQREPGTETLRFPPVRTAPTSRNRGICTASRICWAPCAVCTATRRISATPSTVRRRRGMGQGVVADRPRPDAGRLLSALSSGRGARRYSGDWAGFRRGGGLLPP